MSKTVQAQLPQAFCIPTRELIYSSAYDLNRLSGQVQHLLRGRATLDPRFYLASISPTSWNPRVVVISRDQDIVGVVYAKERKIAGISTGLIFIDTVLDNIVTDGSIDTERLVEKAINRLFRDRNVRGLRLFISPGKAEHRGVQSAVMSQSLDGSHAPVEHHAFLRLPANYEHFLQQFGKHTRRNFRYYRRGFELAGGQYAAEMTFEDFRRAALRLASKDVVGADAEGLNRALNMLAEVKRPLLVGLRINGEYVSVLGGWHESDRTTVFIRVNDDQDHAKMSLSIVLRAYLIEELIRQRVHTLLFWAGVGEPYLSQCEPGRTICAFVDRTSFSWRMVRRFSRSAIAWLPTPMADHLRWIAPQHREPESDLVFLGSPISMGRLRNAISRLEGWWFDRTRHVSTNGAVTLDGLSLAGDHKQGLMYLPSRSATVRLALRNLPIIEHHNYTFVDLGSGKGRMLFLAAEYPFRKIVGVEFAMELHSEAQQNIARYRSRKKRCSKIESVNLDATDYIFPHDNLVIALFNPFGPEVMESVLRHIQESVVEYPRDVLLMMLFPELATVIDPRDWHILKCTRRYHIYRLKSLK